MFRSCSHFMTIPSVLSGLCGNWRPIEVRSPEMFGPKIFEFFMRPNNWEWQNPPWQNPPWQITPATISPKEKFTSDKISLDKIPYDKILHDRIPHDKIPRAGPNIRQTRTCVRYYIRLRALLYYIIYYIWGISTQYLYRPSWLGFIMGTVKMDMNLSVI